MDSQMLEVDRANTLVFDYFSYRRSKNPLSVNLPFGYHHTR